MRVEIREKEDRIRSVAQRYFFNVLVDFVGGMLNRIQMWQIDTMYPEYIVYLPVLGLTYRGAPPSPLFANW